MPLRWLVRFCLRGLLRPALDGADLILRSGCGPDQAHRRMFQASTSSLLVGRETRRIVTVQEGVVARLRKGDCFISPAAQMPCGRNAPTLFRLDIGRLDRRPTSFCSAAMRWRTSSGVLGAGSWPMVAKASRASEAGARTRDLCAADGRPGRPRLHRPSPPLVTLPFGTRRPPEGGLLASDHVTGELSPSGTRADRG